MIIKINEARLLQFLRLCDNLLIEVYPDKVSLIGEKSEKRMFFQYVEETDIEILKPTSFVLNKDGVVSLETFLKNIPSSKNEVVEIVSDDYMPELSINKTIHNTDQKATIAVPIDFENEAFDEIDEVFPFKIKEDKKVCLNRKFIESLKRSNYFVEHNSELEPARYVELTVNESEGNYTTLGFTGFSGYEEKILVEEDLDQNKSKSKIQLKLYSSIVNELYKNRTVLDINNVIISETEDEEYYYISDNIFTFLIKVDKVKDINFRGLFDQNYDVEIKDIPLFMVETALKGIPGSNRVSTVCKLEQRDNNLALGDANVFFNIAQCHSDIAPLYFKSKDISSFISNIKKMKATHLDIKIFQENKLMRMDASSEKGKARFIIIGLDVSSDIEAFS